jgi:hypothetical protein
MHPAGPEVPPGPIDSEETGGIIPLSGGSIQRPGETKRLQRRLKLILQRVAWEEQRASLFRQLRDSDNVRERKRARALMDKTPAWFGADVEVRYSGTFDVMKDGRDRFVLHVSGGTPEETFLLVAQFIVTRTRKLPFGSCLRCHKLFRRVRRQRFCSTQHANQTNQRFKRAGLAKPRKSSRRKPAGIQRTAPPPK